MKSYDVLKNFITADTEEPLKDVKVDESDVILILTREEAKIFIHKDLVDGNDQGIIAEEHMLVGTALVIKLREEEGFFKKMLDWTIKQSGMTVVEGVENGKYN